MPEQPSPTDTPRDLSRRHFLGGLTFAAGAGGAVAGGWACAAGASGRDDRIAPPLRDVAGKLAFITGGSSGIGLGMARAFAAAGMRVVIAYIEDEQVATALQFFHDTPAAVHAVRLDVTDREAWPRVADEIEKRHGPVHLLCNNAGVGIQTSLLRASYKDWDWGMGVNLGGVFNGIHTFLPRMLAHGDGAHIVTTASMSGLLPAGSATIYTTAKFAVVGMMESLRGELEGEQIGVSVYCPGLVHTNIYQSERSRPIQFQNEHAADGTGAGEAVLRDRIMPAGMDPLEAGQHVLRGVRSNSLFILSHPEFKDGLQERFDTILAAFPEGEMPPATRLAAEQTVMRNPLYAHERERQLVPRR